MQCLSATSRELHSNTLSFAEGRWLCSAALKQAEVPCVFPRNSSFVPDFAFAPSGLAGGQMTACIFQEHKAQLQGQERLVPYASIGGQRNDLTEITKACEHVQASDSGTSGKIHAQRCCFPCLAYPSLHPNRPEIVATVSQIDCDASERSMTHQHAVLRPDVLAGNLMRKSLESWGRTGAGAQPLAHCAESCESFRKAPGKHRAGPQTWYGTRD